MEGEEDVKNQFYNLSYEYITDILVDQIFDENMNNISEYFVSGEKNGILFIIAFKIRNMFKLNIRNNNQRKQLV